jgi:hypothetical protein
MTTTAAERIAMRTATEAAAWIEQRRTSRSVVYALGQPILPLSQELWTNRPDVRRFGMAAVSAACVTSRRRPSLRLPGRRSRFAISTHSRKWTRTRPRSRIES